MHSTTLKVPRAGVRRWAFAALIGAILLLATAVPALAAQRPDYTGGLAAGDYPVYVGNDYTMSALRFSATAGTLQDVAGNAVTTAGVQYWVKIRLTPNADGSPAGTDNRGFTWNPATQAWVQERADWADFPTVTTGAGGAITAGNTWYFFRFGDTTKSGTYRVLVSLQPVGGGSGTTQNNVAPPAVTVLDMTGTLPGSTAGFVVHNGVATGLSAKRAEADISGSTSPVWALSRTADPASTMPLQFSPGLWNGANATSGDFALAVPVSSAFDVRLQNAIWPASAPSFTGGLADVNVALGATDTTPPSAPGTLTVVSGDTTAALSWGAATDASGVSGYIVYRWTDAPAGAGYTPLPVAVHTTTGAETTWTDTGLSSGTVYHYAVRAVDAATNVGPRAAAATALTLAASPTTVAWGKPWTLSGVLTAAGAAVPDAPVKLMRSVGGGAWTLVGRLTPAAGTSAYADSMAAPTQKTRYELVYEGTAAYAGSTSDPVTVTPKVKLGAPVAPATVKKQKSFTVYGSLMPKAKAGSKSVKVKCYLKKNGKWVLKKTVTTKNSTRGSASQYKASASLSIKGSWKLVAYAPETSKFAATTSGSKYLKVK
jgi:Fibronectin type III domain